MALPTRPTRRRSWHYVVRVAAAAGGVAALVVPGAAAVGQSVVPRGEVVAPVLVPDGEGALLAWRARDAAGRGQVATVTLRDGAATSAPAVVSPEGASAAMPVAARIPGGMWLAWTLASPTGDVVQAASSDAAPPREGEPGVAVAAAGRGGFVGLAEAVGGAVRGRLRGPDGVWSAPVRVPSVEGGPAAVAVHGDGTLVVATARGAQRSGGPVLGFPSAMSDVTAEIDGAGAATAAWASSTPGASAVWTADATARGWTTPRRWPGVRGRGRPAAHPELAVTADGGVAMAWNCDRGITLVRRGAGGPWGAPRLVTRNGRDAWVVGIAPQPDGAVAVVWAAEARLWARRVDVSGHRGAVVALTGRVRALTWADVAAHDAGGFTVAWRHDARIGPVGEASEVISAVARAALP